MWDLIVSVPDHCLSFYFIIASTDLNNAHILRTCVLESFNDHKAGKTPVIMF